MARRVLGLVLLVAIVLVAAEFFALLPGDWLRPVVLLGGGPALIAAAPLRLVSSLRFRGSAVRGVGIVERCEDASYDEPGYDVSVRFTALDGTEHDFTDETSRRRPVGGEVRIMYDPAKPSDARLDGPLAAEFLVALITFAVGVALTYLGWTHY